MQTSQLAVAAAQPPVAESPEIAAERMERLRDAASGIIGRLSRLAEEQVTARKQIETRWLEDLRMYHGRYDALTEQGLLESDRSRAFVKKTGSKTDAWEARLSDMLFPADDRNWGIKPTPVPELTQAAMEAADRAKAAVKRANAAIEDGDPAAEQAALQEGQAAAEEAAAADAEAAEARKRCDAMQKEIEDQLVESLYPKRCRDVIRDACKLGVGILKGPSTSNRVLRSWNVDPETGVATMVARPDVRPEFRRVDPWTFFPDMSATSMDDCEFTFERHLPTRTDLKRMARRLGFDPAAVGRLVTEGTGIGSDSSLTYLTDLRTITGEGEAIANRFVMWEYHGPLECEEVASLLRAVGRHEDADAYEQDADPLDERRVILFFCGSELLKISEEYPLDSGDSLYSVFPFRQGEASVLGAQGVPAVMMDSARALNAAWRMMLDNGALSVGPQVVVDKARIEPENGNWELEPFKVWISNGKDVTPNQPAPFETFNIPMNQAQLAGIIELASGFIDDETSLPLIAQGDQGTHTTQTANGMAILFNSANVIFRRVVKNWDDDLTTPSIRRIYDWNMQHSRKAAIKGDMQVDARGTSVLLVKELQSQNLMVIATTWSVHPTLGLMMKSGGYQAARMTLQSLNISPEEIFKSEAEYQSDVKAQAEQSAGQETPEAAVAKARFETAKLQAETSLEIANIQRETEMFKLAQQGNIKLDELEAMLEARRIDTRSKERIFAAEVGAESMARREAAATGAEMKGSGGYVSA